jgi:AcrR family transcriptional regulator
MSTRKPKAHAPPARTARKPAKARARAAIKAQTERGASTRQRIVVAARAVAVKHGLADWTLRGVAAHSGISLGNLQFHFKNRDELLCAVLQAELENGRSFVLQAMEQAADPVQGAIDALLALQHQRGAARLFFSLWAAATTSASVRSALHAFYAQWLEQLSAYAPQARERVWLFIALIEGASLYRCGIAGELDAARERDLREQLRALVGLSETK